ncbi:hypothetical protein JVU11DRAFT_11702 [Chiua virens]|nr:hypothetical protein JVU11DRAFT_11702 [Chiua virens]
MINCHQRHFTRLRIYAPPCVGKDEADSSNRTKFLVLEESRLWSSQTNITYSFLDKEKENLELYRKKALVTTAMNEYTKYANVRFQEKDEDATNIRISFESESGNGALVGTDALMANSGSTVNLGGMDLGRDDTSNFAMALHAIGHVLGLLHEVKGNSTNFKQYDSFSVMACSGKVSDRTELSDSDKAWLTLNYPKAPLNKPGGPDDIWTAPSFAPRARCQLILFVEDPRG